MIRSVKVTTKYSNSHKLNQIKLFQEEYTKLVGRIIHDIWTNGYINQNGTIFDQKKKEFHLESNLNNTFLKQFDNEIFTQRMLQACGTQASSIIRSCTVKSKQTKYIISKLMKQKQIVSKLQSKLDGSKLSMPEFKLIQPQLDSRFFDIASSQSEFDGFIQLRLFKNQNPIRMPFKKHKKLNQYEKEGKLLNSIRLNADCVSLSYELPEKEKRTTGIKLGADQGIVTTLSLSDGQTTKKNNHGYDLRSIMNVLGRKKKGSKGFLKTQQHRLNYINWSINQLNLDCVKCVNLEKLFQVRKGTNKGRFLSSFTYSLIKEKLNSRSELEGFEVAEIGNEFRSQRCSECGWTQKSNRVGKKFSCKKCKFIADSDLNASLNLEEDQLPLVPKWVREERRNLKGFLWNLNGVFDSSGEHIVPRVQKLIGNDFLS